MTQPISTVPDQDVTEDTDAKPGRAWRVILYNDNVHRFEDVVLWVQKATGCSLEVATHVTLTAHRMGRAVCFEGSREQCHRVAGALRRNGLQVEVDDLPC